jgi:predicted kinase
VTNNKEVIIMSGIPGSGKSTWIVKNKPDAYICSADNYWLRELSIEESTDLPIIVKDNKTYVYEYDVTRAKDAHAWCMSEFLKALDRGEKTVIVDNTNITVDQYQHYLFTAEIMEYEPRIVQFIVDSRDVLFDCVNRNKHAVPLDVMVKMFINHEHVASKFKTECYEFENIGILHIQVE